MKTKFAALVVLALIAGLVVALQPTHVSWANENATCTLDYFRADVTFGPNKGLAVEGSMKLDIAPDGDINGMLMPKQGDPVMVTGQATGKAIGLVFIPKDQNKGLYIFGTGTMTGKIKDCKGVLGGTLSTNKTGDGGDWWSCTGSGAKGDCARGG
jgi:hypothetical protein